MLLCLMGVGAAIAQPLLETALNEQVRMIAIGATPGLDVPLVELETTIYRPPGNGPFPLVIMNHGKQRGDPRQQRRDRFLSISREFVKRGYAVMVPMRRGFARSTGIYFDHGCNMTSNGYLQAADLQGILDYARGQDWIDSQRILVAGQSFGGLATMALGTLNPEGVRGLINFAGGLRTHNGNCAWQESLVRAFSEYGARSTLPSLWFYGQNDSYFNHMLAFRLHDAYLGGGGKARLVAYGDFKRDAHGMAGSRDGVEVWWPETEKFLRGLGMPTEVVVELPPRPLLARSDFAPLDQVEAIPYLQDMGREAYRTFLSKSLPRAFAVGPNGAWSWAEDGDDPIQRVLASCERSAGQPCRLYAVDDYVVWTDNTAPDKAMEVMDQLQADLTTPAAGPESGPAAAQSSAAQSSAAQSPAVESVQSVQSAPSIEPSALPQPGAPAEPLLVPATSGASTLAKAAAPPASTSQQR